ncbi:protein SOSEKI 2 [Gastrolobium bilobum]|uniref:protein SOSEKI 2 n=1 Tax=Gastrolobium bilobum TaxID=150636 RepID=UPI002AB15331|nr:protein SOSEKI 2 [Gastrolobium bilobum]
MEVRSQRGSRDTSPDRAKICRSKQKVKPARKVQVVYYLSRNGLLEHPHYMEVTLLANQPLRLKDVFDRLMALRGSGMPLQYSWSSKRNYKNGYVWCDLALKDIIHPAEGGEYVLKGSELVEGCSERFQQVNLSNKQVAIHQQQESNYNYNSKSKPFSGSLQKEAEEYEEYEEHDKEYEDGEKTSNTSSTTTPHSRCSRGVSTEELVDDEDHHDAAQNNNTKVIITSNHSLHSHHHHVPPSNSTTLAEKLKQGGIKYPRRIGDGTESGTVSVTSSAPSRYSVLLQLIACGSSAAEFKGKQEARLSNVGTKQRDSVDRSAASAEKTFSEGDQMMINCVSENPRLLGNLQSEEKEYFSGSLVESMKAKAEPVLKKSNSYNEERRSKLGMEVKVTEEDKRETKGGVKEKCIPLKKSSKESRK